MSETKEPERYPCMMCGKLTRWVVNIRFKAVPLCNGCATVITKQQVQFMDETQDRGQSYD